MTPQQFYKAVVRMRQLQRDAERAHGFDQRAIRLAKEAEREIDIEIERVKRMTAERQQLRLSFDEKLTGEGR